MKNNYKIEMELSPYLYHTIIDVLRNEVDFYTRKETRRDVLEELPEDEIDYRVAELNKLIKLFEGNENDKKN